MLQLLFERLRMHSVAKRGEDWANEVAQLTAELVDHQITLELEKKEMEAYIAARDADLAQIAEAREALDYAVAMQDSFTGGPATEGTADGQGQSEGQGQGEGEGEGEQS